MGFPNSPDDFHMFAVTNKEDKVVINQKAYGCRRFSEQDPEFSGSDAKFEWSIGHLSRDTEKTDT